MSHLPAIKRFALFLRRRAPVMAGTFTLLMLLVGAVLWQLPTVYVARATVCSEGERYQGPAGALVAEVTSEQVLERIAHEAGMSPPGQLVTLLGLLPVSETRRMRVPEHPRLVEAPGEASPGEFAVWTRGLRSEEALASARALAQELVELDTIWCAELEPRAELPAPEVGSSRVEEYRMSLAQLRRDHPRLGDPEVQRRFEREAEDLERERRELAGLETRLAADEAESQRLAGMVEEEATLAYRTSLEETRRLELERERRVAEAARSAILEEPPRRPSRVEELREELRKLLATRTPRHPEVRSVLRRLELELARVGEEGLDAEGTPPEEESNSRTVKPVAQPDADGLLPVADDPVPSDPAPPEGAQAPAPQPEAIPASQLDPWRARTHSYALWSAARAREQDTRASVAVRRQELEAREAAHRRRAAELDVLAEARVEETRLMGLLEQAEARREATQRPLSDQPRRPLKLGEAARVVSVLNPWKQAPLGLLLASLGALLAGLFAEQRDRSFHGQDEVSEVLGVPVLGVIPRLRRGRGR